MQKHYTLGLQTSRGTGLHSLISMMTTKYICNYFFLMVMKKCYKLPYRYGDRFYRMWTYYLESSAGGFEARMVNLWQVVLSKDGLENYRAAR